MPRAKPSVLPVKLHVSAAPITPGAKWVLSCGTCQMRRDSAAPDRQTALDEFRRDHDRRHADIAVDSVDYSEHPLHKGARR